MFNFLRLIFFFLSQLFNTFLPFNLFSLIFFRLTFHYKLIRDIYTIRIFTWNIETYSWKHSRKLRLRIIHWLVFKSYCVATIAMKHRIIVTYHLLITTRALYLRNYHWLTFWTLVFIITLDVRPFDALSIRVHALKCHFHSFLDILLVILNLVYLRFQYLEFLQVEHIIILVLGLIKHFLINHVLHHFSF